MIDEEGAYYGPPDLEKKVYVHPEKQVNHTFNLLQFANMAEDAQFEAMDASITACEKYPNNPGHAAREIKQVMDVKYPSGWNVIVGEAYGFEIQYESQFLLYFYCNGTYAVLIWKC